ncbi:MAG: DUF1549 and DUF1553 domain-containing protein [Limisphaerales bacterium]
MRGVGQPCGVAGCLLGGSLLLSFSLHAAPAPRAFTPNERAYWAFQRVGRPNPPKLAHDSWSRNPIDTFVLAALRANHLEPSPPADRVTLLRRATLDLTGLPPTPDEVDAFLGDGSPDAFEKVIDRLLASPHYGEHWARHWLDLARYAESEGFKEDETRPSAWRYRDYVIRSLNRDKPYDRFVREQVAGDELWPDDPDALVATAFNRHYPDEHNARNLMQRRQEILNDITDTVGAVFTGMTFACARCHDHKFDPIRQADYYRLQAFFADVRAADDLVLAPADAVQRYQQKMALWEARTQVIRDAMNAIEQPHRKAIEKDLIEKYPREIQDTLIKPAAERTSFDRLMYYKAEQYLDPNSYLYVAPTSAVIGRMKGEERKRWDQLEGDLEKYADLKPAALPIGTGIRDAGCDAPPTHTLNRGVYDQPKEAVAPGFLMILDPQPAKVLPLPGLNSTGRRTALASLLTDPQNPLTARVMVNRLWHYHFGRGIVGTPSDFGVKGDRPTHPELLDWLAGEFVRNGWSLKQMHRLIMTSSTYRQSSAYREAAAKVDPDNQWLWRFRRHRLEGETIRDAALAVAGRLNPEMGGPSVFPELPRGMTVRGGWKVTPDRVERDRRSIYVFVRRNTRYPMFEAFDMPDTHESCPRRNVTTNPIQALTMLNSELTLDWARSFAGRVLESAGARPDRQIETAYRLALGRNPDPGERRIVTEFFSRQEKILADRAAAGGKLALPAGPQGQADRVEAAALVDFCHMLINGNEFLYVN